MRIVAVDARALNGLAPSGDRQGMKPVVRGAKPALTALLSLSLSLSAPACTSDGPSEPAAATRPAAPVAVPPEGVSQETVDAFVAAWARDNAALAKAGGISVAVATPGVLRVAAAGAAGAEGRPLTTSAWLQMGSVTKTYVTAELMRLAEAGLVELDVPVARWVPDAPGAATTTLRQLLDMTAGLPDYLGTPVWLDANRKDTARSWTLSEVLTLPPKTPPQPGPWAYCNTCYIVAGRVLEAVTGTDYETALRTRLIAPTGLTETDTTRDGHAVADGTFLLDESSPTQSTRDLGTYRAMESTAGTAGCMTATPRDVAKFGQLLLAGSVVSKESWDQMRRYTPDGHYGLAVADFAPITSPGGAERRIDGIGNNGEIPGYGASLVLYEAEQLVVVAMSNDDRINALAVAGDLGRAALTALAKRTP
jgi:CubicO group peptidase (beta-lactamase class C family)